jgi:hypothetical protein
MMDPILAQQDQKWKGWDRQAWRAAEHSIILVQLDYRGGPFVCGVAGLRGRASAVVAAEGASWSVDSPPVYWRAIGSCAAGLSHRSLVASSGESLGCSTKRRSWISVARVKALNDWS